MPFEQWPEEFERIDIAISSTAAPHHILDRARLEPLMKRRKHRPLLLIDIAVPRDIDPAVSELDNVYLYNVDDLQAIADEYLKLRHEELNRCEPDHRRESRGVAGGEPAFSRSFSRMKQRVTKLCFFSSMSICENLWLTIYA